MKCYWKKMDRPEIALFWNLLPADRIHPFPQRKRFHQSSAAVVLDSLMMTATASIQHQIFFPLIPASPFLPSNLGAAHRIGLQLMKIIRLNVESDENAIDFPRCLILICSRLQANNGFKARWWNNVCCNIRLLVLTGTFYLERDFSSC